MAALLLHMVALGSAQTIPKQAELDAAVIRASAEHLFTLPSEFALDFDRGNIVVIRPSYRGNRPSIVAELQSARDGLGKELAEMRKPRKDPTETDEDRRRSALFEKEWLRMLNALKGLTLTNAKVVEMPELASLNLGPKVSVTDQQRSEFGLKDNNIRLFLTLAPPGFSTDFNNAVVKGSFPWSMHHGDVTFFLRKANAKWQVIALRTVLFV